MAYKSALQGNFDYKLGSVIVRGGNILSTGFCRKEYHPQAFYGESVHAEHDAIRKCNPPLRQAKMFVYRFSGKGDVVELKSSKPCCKCQQEIRKASISRVVFVDENNMLCKEDFRNTPEIPRPEMKHLAFGGISGIY